MKPTIYCPDEGTWPLDWPSEVVAASDYEALLAETNRLRAMVEVIDDSADCEDQGFSSISEGCRVCMPTFVDDKPVYPRIVARGKWWLCEKCGGSYGPIIGEGTTL